MVSARLLRWRVPPGSYVSCYDVLYEVSALGVSLPDGPSKESSFELECCDEGYLAVVFEDDEAGGTTLKGGECVGILAESEEECKLLQERYARFKAKEPRKASLRGMADGDLRQGLAFLAADAGTAKEEREEPRVMQWHAYIMNIAKGSVDDKSGCGCN